MKRRRFANHYTYTGRRFDSETGLYYYRNRYYDAQLGRFVSRDPAGYEGSEWNLYEYCASDPILRTDPSGLSAAEFAACVLRETRECSNEMGHYDYRVWACSIPCFIGEELWWTWGCDKVESHIPHFLVG